jgi:hypothetical protein
MSIDEALRVAFGMVGVDAVYGQPFGDLEVTQVSAPVAPLLVKAHRRVQGRLAAVHRGGGEFVLGTPDSLVPRLVLEHAGDVLAFVEQLQRSVADDHSAVLDVRLPPGTLAPQGPPWPLPLVVADEPAAPSDKVLQRLRQAEAPVMLAGPGVVGHTPGLHAVAAAANLGVLNTWGAKGVFDWRSRHHWATVGLQQRDFELGGLADADLVVAAGLDPDETPGEAGAYAPVVSVLPEEFNRLSELWWRPVTELTVPPLRAGLAAVTQQGWARQGAPLAPSQVTRNYGRITAGRGLVAADPGTAGFWVARTFPTTTPGEALVPSRPDDPGFAVACAIVARLRAPRRPVLAVLDAPAPGFVDELLEQAAVLGVPVVIERWDPDGPALDADQHLERLAAAMWSTLSTVLTVATDPSQLDAIQEVAGEIVAWTDCCEGLW